MATIKWGARSASNGLRIFLLLSLALGYFLGRKTIAAKVSQER